MTKYKESLVVIKDFLLKSLQGAVLGVTFAWKGTRVPAWMGAMCFHDCDGVHRCFVCM